MRGNNHVGDISIYGRTLLKCFMMKWGVRIQADYTGSG
jgi:hypothetical protein